MFSRQAYGSLLQDRHRRQDPVRAAILEDGLREAGHVQVVHIDETAHLLARIYTIDPDVILIDLENPSRDVLEQMFQVSRAVKRPVAMFVDQSDRASIEAAVDAGVSAYIVGGLRKERVRNILDRCVSRFNSFSKLENELERARSAFEDRKVIDRAKGILMKKLVFMPDGKTLVSCGAGRHQAVEHFFSLSTGHCSFGPTGGMVGGVSCEDGVLRVSDIASYCPLPCAALASWPMQVLSIVHRGSSVRLQSWGIVSGAFSDFCAARPCTCLKAEWPILGIWRRWQVQAPALAEFACRTMATR